jgi:hypothetical protein
MPTLYEIRADLLALVEQVEFGGEVPEGLAAALDRTEGVLADKLDAVLRAYQTYESQANQIGREIERLARKKKTAEKRAAWLKQYAFDTLSALKMTRMTTPLFNLCVVANSRPLFTLAADAPGIPAGYVKERPPQPPPELDKDKCYEAYKAGKTLPSPIVVTVGSHLLIT